MSALSDYIENKLIDLLLRGQSFGPVTTVYAALFTSGPTDAGGGTEVTGGNYSRVSITCSLTAFTGTHGSTSGVSSGTTGASSNASVIQFATPSASWGTVTHIGLFDAASGGNLLIHGQLSAPKIINTNDDVKFITGAFTFQIDN